jgi:uncharacterized protein (TIGR03067 family)
MIPKWWYHSSTMGEFCLSDVEQGCHGRSSFHRCGQFSHQNNRLDGVIFAGQAALMKNKVFRVFLFSLGFASLNALGDESTEKKNQAGKEDPRSQVLSDEKVKKALGGDRVEDLKKIQGTWNLTALEVDGHPAPPEIVAALKFVFKNGSVTIDPGEPGWTNFKYTLDPTTEPSGYTIAHADGPKKGEMTKGIYSLDGDRLEICLPEGDEKPTEFTAKAGSGQILYSLERTKIVAKGPEKKDKKAGIPRVWQSPRSGLVN